jgi:hypothetical protein
MENTKMEKTFQIFRFKEVLKFKIEDLENTDRK